MTKEQLLNRFWTDVETTVKGFHLGIASDCVQHLRGFVLGGINRLEQEGALNNLGRIGKAETHLVAFIGGMAYEAKTQNLTALHEFTFEAVKRRFCPLWPFC